MVQAYNGGQFRQLIYRIYLHHSNRRYRFQFILIASFALFCLLLWLVKPRAQSPLLEAPRLQEYSPFGSTAQYSADLDAGVLETVAGVRKWKASKSLSQQLPFGGLAVRSSEVSVEDFISERPQIVTFCHPNWHGIRQATWGQGYPVLEIPGVVSDVHTMSLINFISYLRSLKTVIVNGIPPNTVQFATVLRKHFPQLKIIFIYHGSLAQPFHEAEAGIVDEMIVAALNGAIDKIGIVKNGMVDAFRAMGVDAEEVWNFPEAPFYLRPFNSIKNLPQTLQILPELQTNPRIAKTERRHRQDTSNFWQIGVFGSQWVHKNLFVQVFALCKLPNVVIHVLSKPKLSYLEHCKAEIVAHGEFLEHGKFLRLVRSMHITLYVSLTEAFPMTVIESISAGIPAITSATSSVYSLDPVLEKMLVVPGLDSPDYIAQAVQDVIKGYREISSRLWRIVPYIYMKAQLQMSMLLEDDNQFEVPQLEQGSTENLKPKVLSEKGTICLVSDGLFPYQYSDISLVTNSLAIDLLKDGHKVILLVYCGDDDASCKNGQKLKIDSRFAIYFVHALLSHESSAHHQKSESMVLALALEQLSKISQFDLVEIPDYRGWAYELLQVSNYKYQMLHDNALQNVDYHKYIPDSVMVAVRVYGTQQLRDQESSALTLSANFTQKLLYMKEQYCLLTADKVFYERENQSLYLNTIYGVQQNELILAGLNLDHLKTIAEEALKSYQITNSGKENWRGSQQFLVWDPFSNQQAFTEALQDCIKFVSDPAVIRSYPDIKFIFVLPEPLQIVSQLSSAKFKPSLFSNAAVRSFHSNYNDLPESLKKYFEIYATVELDELVWLTSSVRAVIQPPVWKDYQFSTLICSMFNAPTLGPFNSNGNGESEFPDFAYSLEDVNGFAKEMLEVLEDEDDRRFMAIESKIVSIRSGHMRLPVKMQSGANTNAYAIYDTTSIIRRRQDNVRAEWIQMFIRKLEVDILKERRPNTIHQQQ